MADERFRAALALAPLKTFQRHTVDYAFDRLFGSDDPVRQFLVADEVGLGKTMVARGIVARMIEHLWDTTKRIDVLYICSNQAIAVQRRRNRTANVTIIPVDVRTWDAHIPVDTHLVCKDLLTRLKSGK